MSGKHRPGKAPKSTGRRLGGHVLALSSGAAVQRIVVLISQVVIARIVGPSSLGALAVAQALLVFSSIFTDGGMTNLSLRRVVREPDRRNQIVSATLGGQLILAAIAVCALVVVALAAPWHGGTGALILALAPSLFCSAFNMSYVLKAAEQMGSVAVYRAVAAILPAIASVALVAATKDIIWVAIATDAGLLVGALLVFVHIRRHGVRLVRAQWTDIRAVARAGLPFLGTAALLIVPPTSVTVIVAGVLGNHEAGVYSAAWQLSYAALTVAALVADAVYPELVRRADSGTQAIAEFLRVVLRLMCRLLFPAAVAVAFAADRIVALLFGGQFAASAPLLRVLVLIVPFGFLWVFVGQALTAANGERSMFVRTSVITVLTLVAVPIAAVAGGVIAVAGTVLAVNVVQTFVYAAPRIGGRAVVLTTIARESPYAIVPAGLCALGLLTSIGRQLIVVIALAALGVLAWEAIRGWPTPRGLRSLVSRPPAGVTGSV